MNVLKFVVGTINLICLTVILYPFGFLVFELTIGSFAYKKLTKKQQNLLRYVVVMAVGTYIQKCLYIFFASNWRAFGGDKPLSWEQTGGIESRNLLGIEVYGYFGAAINVLIGLIIIRYIFTLIGIWKKNLSKIFIKTQVQKTL